MATAAHIQLKFKIWINHKKMQVKYKFGHGTMIFDRVMPLEVIFSFRSSSSQKLNTFNSNLTYGYFKGMRSSHGSMIFDRDISLEL
jgi:hypothetical protein